VSVRTAPHASSRAATCLSPPATDCAVTAFYALSLHDALPISNNGNATLAITNVVFSGGNAGDFIVTNNTCGSIAPGGFCTLGVTSEAHTPEVHAPAQQLWSIARINPDTAAVSGSGTAPAMVLQ